jgi:hypothetical protein
MQADDRPMARRQAGEGLVEQLAVREATREVVGSRGVDRRQLDLDDASLAATDEVEAGIREESLQPGVEAVRIAKTGQVAPGADHGLLDGVARELPVAEDQTGGRVQPRETHVEELGEGLMIASPRPFDESSLVHGRLG